MKKKGWYFWIILGKIYTRLVDTYTVGESRQDPGMVGSGDEKVKE